MYKVLLVDDEEPVLDSFSFLLSRLTEDFSLCGKARSGHEAIKVARLTHPDIIFMDIAMPGIDGLETIQFLQKEFPETLYILSTAFERFDIAQKAIPLGVFSYLVKPISRKKFLETLDKARMFLDNKKNSVSSFIDDAAQASRTLEREEREFLTKLTWHRFSDQEWLQQKKLLSFNAEKALIYLIEYTPEREDKKQYFFDQLIKEIAYKYQCFSTVFIGRLMICIPMDNESAKLHALITDYIQKNADNPEYVFLGTSGLTDYDELKHGYEKALEHCLLLQGVQNTNSDEIHLYKRIREEALKATVPLETVISSMKILITLLFSMYSLEVAKAKIITLISHITEDQLGDAYYFTGTAYDPFQNIPSFSEKEDCSSWCNWALSKILLKGIRSRTDNKPGPLQKAIDYIDIWYGEQLQLTTVAEICRISPAYLSRLFSEHLHTTFIDYLTDKRVTKAEEAIQKDEMSIKEIAYSVGFQDPNYFSRIFKKYKGVTPSMYVHKRSEKNEK